MYFNSNFISFEYKYRPNIAKLLINDYKFYPSKMLDKGSNNFESFRCGYIIFFICLDYIVAIFCTSLCENETLLMTFIWTCMWF